MDSKPRLTFNPLDHPICLATPDKIGAYSAWIAHVPFGMYLVSLISPRVLVELGTYSGTSFLAFCQAVDTLAFETRCYAVDTWEGDPHIRKYPASVYDNLYTYLEPRYGYFAKLLKMTFDEACGQFSDGEIDLLHIDGYHTYDAVKHDFEKWLPKLSDRGVVVFHDTHERHGDFGVWKLWGELKAQYPSFEFEHSSGLGVLFVGKQNPQAASLAEMPTAEIERVRTFFALRGEELKAQHFLKTAFLAAQNALKTNQSKTPNTPLSSDASNTSVR